MQIRFHLPLIGGLLRGLAIVFVLLGAVPGGVELKGFGVREGFADAFVVGDRFRDCSVCPEMIVVPAGEFVMGSPPHETGRNPHEGPQRTVLIPEKIAIGLYEIKISEWKSCVSEGACASDIPFESEGSSKFGYRGWKRTLPVVGVSWENSKEYAAWLELKTGYEYRLPTEAEWEHAARSGTNTARFWDALEGAACGYANLEGSSGCADGDGYDDLAPVGSYRSNAFGLYDMLGNAAEWTESCWGKDNEFNSADGGKQRASAETVRTKRDALINASDCNKKVYRGGAWNSSLDEARSASRASLGRDVKTNYIGFRVIRALR